MNSSVSELRARLIAKEGELVQMRDEMDRGPRDLDETRRLLYMALAASRTEKYSLVGTLVNALAHHNLGIDPDEGMDSLVTLVEDGDSDSTATVKDLIARLTSLLDNPNDVR